MKLIHSGITYNCEVAVKCENDRYIKLYDASGAEIAAFHNISDFTEYEILDGAFVAPCDCTKPILLSTYVIGGRTIKTTDWIESETGGFHYEINNDLISSNITTCDVLLLFAPGTELEYKATQETGKVVLYADSAPEADIVIDSIQITRT